MILSMVLSLAACNEVETIDMASGISPDLPLNIVASTALTTKGELVEEAEDMGTIGVYCAMTGTEYWSSTTIFSKLNNRCFTSNDGDWVIDGESESWGYENVSDKYTFFAYSPHTASAQGLYSYIKDGELMIDYTVPESSVNQPDLMYALPRKNIFAQVSNSVSLTFYHALSSISFGVVSSTDLKITAINIAGVVSEGSLEWDYDTNTPQWSLKDPTTDSFSVEIANYTLDSDNTAQLNTDRGYLMMIPQTLTYGAEVTLTLNSGEQRSLLIPAGSEWEAGLKYHYVIQLDDADCDFIFDSSQLSNCYIVNPTLGEDTIVQVPIEDRINDFWKNYSGYNTKKIKTKNTTEEYSVGIVWDDFDDNLAFTYEILNDSDSLMAVRLTVAAKYQEGNLVFSVMDDDDSILWSWHLWFTDYNPDAIAAVNSSSIEIGVDKSYTRSGYEGAVHRYKDNSSANDSIAVWRGIYKDKFIMDRNIGERSTYSSVTGAGAVYYQFGRKDPFPGSCATYSDGATQPRYRMSSGFDFYQSVEYSKDLFISSSSSSDNWSAEESARKSNCIWFDENISNSDYSTGKSIFDPSPLGWRVPVIMTWNNFETTESSITGSVGIYSYYGYRNPNNYAALAQVEEVACVWSANPLDSETGYSHYYTKTEVTPASEHIFTYGMPIRAIQE